MVTTGPERFSSGADKKLEISCEIEGKEKGCHLERSQVVARGDYQGEFEDPSS